MDNQEILQQHGNSARAGEGLLLFLNAISWNPAEKVSQMQ
jgi:hypothetical protein